MCKMKVVENILGTKKKKSFSEEESELIEHGILSHHIRDERHYEED